MYLLIFAAHTFSEIAASAILSHVPTSSFVLISRFSTTFPVVFLFDFWMLDWLAAPLLSSDLSFYDYWFCCYSWTIDVFCWVLLTWGLFLVLLSRGMLAGLLEEVSLDSVFWSGLLFDVVACTFSADWLFWIGRAWAGLTREAELLVAFF